MESRLAQVESEVRQIKHHYGATGSTSLDLDTSKTSIYNEAVEVVDDDRTPVRQSIIVQNGGLFSENDEHDMMKRDFEKELESTWVYSKRRQLAQSMSFRNSTLQGPAWSVLSGVTMDMISVVAVIGLPLSIAELNYGHWYRRKGDGADNEVTETIDVTEDDASGIAALVKRQTTLDTHTGEAIVDLAGLNLLAVPLKALETITPPLGLLNLSFNPHIHIPSELHRFKVVRALELRNNELKVFPEGILTLQYLKILDLSNNEIAVFPETINMLSSLVFLDLASNLIERLPQALANIEHMKGLRLEMNQPLQDTPWRDMGIGSTEIDPETCAEIIKGVLAPMVSQATTRLVGGLLDQKLRRTLDGSSSPGTEIPLVEAV